MKYEDMPGKISIYLDTSVPNFLFADDSPEKQEITIDFFKLYIETGRYSTFISEYVIAEINNTNDPSKKERLFQVIDKFPIKILEPDDLSDIEFLALKYIEAGIIPQKKILDALHIAVCTISEIQFLVSWNYKHLANFKSENKVKVVNFQNGYINELRIITPLELFEDGI